MIVPVIATQQLLTLLAMLQDWCNLISAISDQKLKQPLMSQDSQGVLRVNFDAALVRLLREVRYFLLLPDLPVQIPANALKVSEQQISHPCTPSAV